MAFKAECDTIDSGKNTTYIANIFLSWKCCVLCKMVYNYLKIISDSSLIKVNIGPQSPKLKYHKGSNHSRQVEHQNFTSVYVKWQNKETGMNLKNQYT